MIEKYFLSNIPNKLKITDDFKEIKHNAVLTVSNILSNKLGDKVPKYLFKENNNPVYIDVIGLPHHVLSKLLTSDFNKPLSEIILDWYWLHTVRGYNFRETFYRYAYNKHYLDTNDVFGVYFEMRQSFVDSINKKDLEPKSRLCPFPYMDSYEPNDISLVRYYLSQMYAYILDKCKEYFNFEGYDLRSHTYLVDYRVYNSVYSNEYSTIEYRFFMQLPLSIIFKQRGYRFLTEEDMLFDYNSKDRLKTFYKNIVKGIKELHKWDIAPKVKGKFFYNDGNPYFILTVFCESQSCIHLALNAASIGEDRRKHI